MFQRNISVGEGKKQTFVESCKMEQPHQWGALSQRSHQGTGQVDQKPSVRAAQPALGAGSRLALTLQFQAKRRAQSQPCRTGSGPATQSLFAAQGPWWLSWMMPEDRLSYAVPCRSLPFPWAACMTRCSSPRLSLLCL